MITLQPFIDLGWHTVPLNGTLTRLDGGKKTLPDFEKGWQVKYAETKNTRDSKLGGTITGRISGIVAVDCDNPATYAIIKALDPDYAACAVSTGKYDEPTGTFIYQYDESLANGFKIHEKDGLSLDFYTDGGFIYLPTIGNMTKLAWQSVPEIKPMPETVKLLLKQMAKKAAAASAPTGNVITARCLAPLVKQFVDNKEFMPGLFKIITPRDFRDCEQYVKEGYLHPNNVPKGRGSEYMSKVSAILGSDISIDSQLYIVAMDLINNLWADPIDENTFDKTILQPMVNGHASINGEPIWRYNENWADYSLVLSSKRQSSLELGFDDRRNAYYVIDVANNWYNSWERDSELMSYLESAAVKIPSRKEVKASIPIINVVSKPNEDFGFITGNDPTAKDLNLFRQTPELQIFNNPESYANNYKHPTTLLKFLSTLVPEEMMLKYLLGFVKHKFKTFDYSPVILFFLGVHGSGKDTFVQILEKIIGTVGKPTAREFLEVFNGYMLDNYFIQLDEYGNQLQRQDEKEEVLGKLKAYSGKQLVRVRMMRSNGFEYAHRVTFISTANKNPLILEDGDRRMAMLSTPNKLETVEWVKAAGGVSKVYNQVMNEVQDFCYWLATEGPEITAAEYVSPPESAFKHQIIADSMYAAARLAYAIKHGMWKYLINLCNLHENTILPDAIAAQEITTSDFEDLYDAMTEYKGNFKTVIRELQNSGIALRRTTRNHNVTQQIMVEIPAFIGD